MVKISMDVFVRKFQPERYDLWKSGQDVAPHPEDDAGCTGQKPKPKADYEHVKQPSRRRKMEATPELATHSKKRHPYVSDLKEKSPDDLTEDSKPTGEDMVEGE